MKPAGFDRRTALGAFGTIGLGTILAACRGGSSSESSRSEPPSSVPASTTGTAAGGLFDDAASCTLSPQQTEGPFYFDVDSIRADIREDRDGIPLRLATRVLEASSCDPIGNAVVDVWHCDAEGVYSGFDDGEGQTFLRGAQVTSPEGIAEFATVYPGWYRGRTVHIHAKVHLDNSTLLTTQLYFPDDVNDSVFARAPYTSGDGRDTSNAEDGIFDEQMVMTLTEDGDGYAAAMNINVQR